MSKYLNKVTEVDGIKFDSKKEAGYYLYLKQREEHGEISNLRTQVPFEIVPAVYGERIKHLKTKDKTERYCIQKASHYVADFVYIVTATGKQEVIDVKSYITRKQPVYRLKKKLMLAVNGIEIIEV
jgi:hypothetical protein